ncbi:hypothetical protein D3C86_501020 [compost metagenome]
MRSGYISLVHVSLTKGVVVSASSELPEHSSLEARLERLERAVETLTHRLDLLENPERPPATASASELLAAPSPAIPPTADPRDARRGLPRLDWEALIGGQGALWVGSAALFLAVAFFLAYAWQFLGPAGRTVTGFLLGAGLLALGAFSRTRAQHWFGVGVMGAGLAILYLNTWAGFQRSALFGGEAAFALMIATTLVGVVLAVRLGAMSLISLATLGGFMTPLVLGGTSDSLAVLLYVAVLNTGIVATSLFKRWKLPVVLSFAGTVFLLLVLLFSGRLDALHGVTFAFMTLYFAQFFGASCVYSLWRREPTPAEDLFLPCLAALFYALAGYGLVQESLGAWRILFPLLLAAFFGLVSWTASRRVPSDLAFRNVCTGLGLFFLTLTAPIQLEAGWLAAAWAAEAALLETLGIRFGSPLFRRAGQAVFFLYAVTLFLVFLPSPIPFASLERGMSLALGVLAAFWLVTWSSRWKPTGWAIASYSWFAMAGLAALILQQLLAFDGWSQARDPFLAAFGLWAVTAAGGHRFGIRLDVPALRQASITLATLALVGILLVGVGEAFRPVLNLRFAAFALAAGAMLAMASTRERLPEAEATWLERVPLAASVLGIWAFTLETFSAFQHSGIPNWERPAQLGISLWWTLSGALLLAFGVRRKRRWFRLLALGVLGVTALKVFLFDLSSLDTPLRILSFGGLGIVLIAISWLYSRYGLQQDSR